MIAGTIPNQGNIEMDSEKVAGILGTIVAAAVLVIAIAYGPIGQIGKPQKQIQKIEQPKAPASAPPAVRGPVVREGPQQADSADQRFDFLAFRLLAFLADLRTAFLAVFFFAILLALFLEAFFDFLLDLLAANLVGAFLVVFPAGFFADFFAAFFEPARFRAAGGGATGSVVRNGSDTKPSPARGREAIGCSAVFGDSGSMAFMAASEAVFTMLSTASLILSTIFSMAVFSCLPSSIPPSQDQLHEPNPARSWTVPCKTALEGLAWCCERTPLAKRPNRPYLAPNGDVDAS